MQQDIERWEHEGGAIGPWTPAAIRRRTGRLWATLHLTRKVGVAIAGAAVIVVGLAMIVLPGPAIVVIPLGLAIWATEFHWAARLLYHGKQRITRLLRRRGLGRRATATS